MVKIEDYIPKGKQNAIHMESLAKRAGVTPLMVRKLIKKARTNGNINILSGPDGYWISESREEIQRFVESTQKQGLSRLTITKNMRNALKNIDGQITITEDQRQDSSALLPQETTAAPSYDYTGLEYAFIRKPEGILLDSRIAAKIQEQPEHVEVIKGKVIIYDRVRKSDGEITGDHWKRRT